MIPYLIKSGLCLIVLLAIYLLFLEREKMHQFNRFFLLSALVLGLAIPFINIELFPDPNTSSTETQFAAKLARNSSKIVNAVTSTTSEFVVEALETKPNLEEKIETNPVQLEAKQNPPVLVEESETTDQSPVVKERQIPTSNVEPRDADVYAPVSSLKEPLFSLKYIILTLYVLGVLIFLAQFITGILSFYRKSISNSVSEYGSANLVLLSFPTIPHTFLNTIYVNKDQFNSGELNKQILDHELTHAKQKHSFDVLFIEILRIAFWFNPVFYFFKRAIQINHEFLADESVIKQTEDNVSYQKLLLESVFPSYQTTLASSFNYSLTKKRFKMMVKESSVFLMITKKVILVPVILSIGLIFCTKPVVPEDVLYPSVKLTYSGEEIDGYIQTVAKTQDGELFSGTQEMRFETDDRLFSTMSYVNGIPVSGARFDSTGSRVDQINYTTVEGDFRLKDHTTLVDGKEVLIEKWIYPNTTNDGIGFYQQWHRNGVLKSEATFRKGYQYFGLVTVYDENGKIIEQARYKDGREVEVIVKKKETPRAGASPKTFSIEISNNNDLLLDNKSVTLEELESFLIELPESPELVRLKVSPNAEFGALTDVQNILRKYEAFKINYSSLKNEDGTESILPPTPSVLKTPSETTHVIKILMGSHGLLLMNEESVNMSEVRKKIKQFMNSSTDPSKAIFVIKTAPKASYYQYLELLEEITSANNELRDEATKDKFGMTFSNLKENSLEKEMIRKMYPMELSITPPLPAQPKL